MAGGDEFKRRVDQLGARIAESRERQAQVERLKAEAEKLMAEAVAAKKAADVLHARNTATSSELRKQLTATTKLEAVLTAKIAKVEAIVRA
jgi:hypothetical protein